MGSTTQGSQTTIIEEGKLETLPMGQEPNKQNREQTIAHAGRMLLDF